MIVQQIGVWLCFVAGTACAFAAWRCFAITKQMIVARDAYRSARDDCKRTQAMFHAQLEKVNVLYAAPVPAQPLADAEDG